MQEELAKLAAAGGLMSPGSAHKKPQGGWREFFRGLRELPAVAVELPQQLIKKSRRPSVVLARAKGFESKDGSSARRSTSSAAVAVAGMPDGGLSSVTRRDISPLGRSASMAAASVAGAQAAGTSSGSGGQGHGQRHAHRGARRRSHCCTAFGECLSIWLCCWCHLCYAMEDDDDELTHPHSHSRHGSRSNLHAPSVTYVGMAASGSGAATSAGAGGPAGKLVQYGIAASIDPKTYACSSGGGSPPPLAGIGAGFDADVGAAAAAGMPLDAGEPGGPRGLGSLAGHGGFYTAPPLSAAGGRFMDSVHSADSPLHAGSSGSASVHAPPVYAIEMASTAAARSGASAAAAGSGRASGSSNASSPAGDRSSTARRAAAGQGSDGRSSGSSSSVVLTSPAAAGQSGAALPRAAASRRDSPHESGGSAAAPAASHAQTGNSPLLSPGRNSYPVAPSVRGGGDGASSASAAAATTSADHRDSTSASHASGYGGSGRVQISPTGSSVVSHTTAVSPHAAGTALLDPSPSTMSSSSGGSGGSPPSASAAADSQGGNDDDDDVDDEDDDADGIGDHDNDDSAAALGHAVAKPEGTGSSRR